MYPAVIMILRLVDLLMQIMLICWVQMTILQVSIFSYTVETIRSHALTTMDNFGILLLVQLLVLY